MAFIIHALLIINLIKIVVSKSYMYTLTYISWAFQYFLLSKE
ncbi:hypothetical protein CNEO4_2450007 [Clostridium neonatale]|uniref:Uncharacterized protein n=1 Tax=Clostridium neonatale TaxID=137838 RepID=A0AA86JCC6_9CLOT|nr:hypothetical protein CNEO_10079 [Clostridium neonatale]CAG9713068.1 hypothetical protein CNEO_1870008 [Clostridium neonatale]CAI3192643.1 hypothetical protein CNEO2_1080015 [Clostridium neonatale]CAI3211711.1 hypothetical protein CNEO2_700034 [Clostridium neonatale]CAI3214200.1 hypothetical protein CNEO2_710006 [Clostridium neonatale]